MADNLIELSREKYDKAGVYGNTSYSSGMASLFTKGMGAILDYSALKKDLKNYNLSIKGTELGMQSVELQATQMANKLRQQYIEQAGNYAYNAARRGVAVSSGSVQSGLRRTAEEMGKDVQNINREAELEKKNLEMQKAALRAQKKIQKYQARAGLAMTGLDLGLQAMEKTATFMTGGVGAGIEDMGGTKTGVVPLPTRKPTRG